MNQKVTRDMVCVGDYNMSLMDQLLMQPKLNFIGCCNELNAGGERSSDCTWFRPKTPMDVTFTVVHIVTSPWGCEVQCE